MTKKALADVLKKLHKQTIDAVPVDTGHMKPKPVNSETKTIYMFDVDDGGC